MVGDLIKGGTDRGWGRGEGLARKQGAAQRTHVCRCPCHKTAFLSSNGFGTTRQLARSRWCQQGQWTTAENTGLHLSFTSHSRGKSRPSIGSSFATIIKTAGQVAIERPAVGRRANHSAAPQHHQPQQPSHSYMGCAGPSSGTAMSLLLLRGGRRRVHCHIRSLRHRHC
jgi:hypothetical protein